MQGCIWKSAVSLLRQILYIQLIIPTMALQILIYIYLSLYFLRIQAYDKEMTISIDSGKQECFFHKVQEGETIDFEYQVIDGGDLDISFTMFDPVGLVIVSDYKKAENIHRHDVRKSGDFRFCFDNIFSSFNKKTVFFELIVEREGDEHHGDDQWNEVLEGLTKEEYYDMKVQDIMDYIGRIRMSITKAQQIQELLRSFEARDRNLAEKNYNKVNYWSCVQTVIMVLVGLLQVFMLRSIFETDSRLSKLWRKVNF